MRKTSRGVPLKSTSGCFKTENCDGELFSNIISTLQDLNFNSLWIKSVRARTKAYIGPRRPNAVRFLFFFWSIIMHIITLFFFFFAADSLLSLLLVSSTQSRRCFFLNRSTQCRKMWESFSSRCTAVETSARSSWWSATHSRVRASLFSPHLTRLPSVHSVGPQPSGWTDRVGEVTLFYFSLSVSFFRHHILDSGRYLKA